MSVLSLGFQHLTIRSAEDVHAVFQQLGYDVYDPEPYEGDDLDVFELDDADRQTVNRAYIVAQRDNHTVYLYEVTDLRQARLRGLAWHALQRGTALLIVTRDYREILFVDPRTVGKVNKRSVRVNKLKLITRDATRHDLDTLNAIHAHRRSGQQIYDAQAEAFNVTTITKKFYDEYRRHYERAREAIRQHNPGVREFVDSSQTDKLHAFTQRLLGRLMFLYFLQRKGWLGDRQRFLTEMYLNTMRAHAHELDGGRETSHYYREVLEPLFFDTMNQKRPGDITRWQGIRIPYLNGGLFDESRDPQGPIIIPDALFDPNSSDGLLAFFNRYNFTIVDDTPLEQDVAVDPEMLGKVFENMLEERDRGQSGSFYTPRTIVAYMCQEALAGYLEESADVPRDVTRAQFDPDSDVRYTPEQAARVNAALDTLTVLDPAVGSGSFLIGMLNEVIRLRRACYAAQHGHDDIPAAMLADWKEAVIRDTLYGVDIKPEAIEIAQLRLWLALVVDQTLEQARPLPNLDYKLMAGNSLIETIDGQPVLGSSAQAMLGGDVTPQQPTLGMFDTDRERVKLDDLRARFFRASPDERRRLKADIGEQERRIVATSLRERADALQDNIRSIGGIAARTGGRLKAAEERKLRTATDQLARLTALQEAMGRPDYAPPFFLYRLHFSEVFERKGGFDIVVANPPYVRQELIGDQKPELEASYPNVYAGTADLYVYFFARSFDLLRPKGQLSFITPNKFMRANYGKKLRGFLATKTRLHTLIDFGDLPIFDATTYPMITLAGKHTPDNNKVNVLEITSLSDSETPHAAAESAYALPQNTLTAESWHLGVPATRQLLEKLRNAGMPLGEYVNGRMYRGVVTGLNEAFIIDEAKRSELIAADPRSSEVIKPFLRGRDIKRWQIGWSGSYLLFMKPQIRISDYPAVYQHLLQFRTSLEKKAGNNKWYELQTSVGYYREFETVKIVYPDISKTPAFAIDSSHFFVNDTTFFTPFNDVFLLGVLNSAVTQFFLSEIASVVRGGFYRFKNIYVKTIPVPDPPPSLRDRIAALARRCLDAAQSAPETLPALESELNGLVYQAYGLDQDDIAVIEGYLAGRPGSVSEGLEEPEL